MEKKKKSKRNVKNEMKENENQYKRKASVARSSIQPTFSFLLTGVMFGLTETNTPSPPVGPSPLLAPCIFSFIFPASEALVSRGGDVTRVQMVS